MFGEKSDILESDRSKLASHWLALLPNYSERRHIIITKPMSTPNLLLTRGVILAFLQKQIDYKS